MLKMLTKRSAKIEALDLTTRDRPPLPSEQVPPAPQVPPVSDGLQEYRDLAQAVGLAHPHIDADLAVERFKAFLRRKDWPIFSLPTVVAYMDKKAAEESAAQAGWQWHPLREKDNIPKVKFGQEAYERPFDNGSVHKQVASDYYRGAGKVWDHRNERGWVNAPASAAPYDKLVPLHALRKVAEVEREFDGPASFFVCDYAPAPHVEYPDPFLMVVVNNGRLDKGYGRFVIDFWDEPGFGLDEMLG